jgi:hypothetical protein
MTRPMSLPTQILALVGDDVDKVQVGPDGQIDHL